MRFRFNNFNPLYRIYYTSKLNSQSNTTHLPIIQSLNPQFPDYTCSVFSDKLYFKVPVRWHLGHSHHDKFSGKDAENIFRLGLASDIGLATGKALTGYLSGSTAIIADAAHSMSDVVLSGVALWSFKAAKAPKDKEHPYGRF